MYNRDLEIREAVEAGERALRSLRDARSSLGSARGWGMVDMFGGLVEALARTMTLVKYYAPEGELLSAILSDAYCSPRDFTEVNICSHLNISRSTLYRRKPKALLYAGYYFYEAVLPDMAGKI